MYVQINSLRDTLITICTYREADQSLTTGGHHWIGCERDALATYEPGLEVHDGSCNCIDAAGNIFGNVCAGDHSNAEFQTPSEITTDPSSLDTLCRAPNSLFPGRSSIDGKLSVCILCLILAVGILSMAIELKLL